jgi:hypothetical protein
MATATAALHRIRGSSLIDAIGLALLAFVVVWVVVTASNPDDEGRIHQRGELLVQETLNKLLG